MKAPVSLAWHEFAHAHFGHWARTTRVMQMWERLSSHPSGTVSAVFEVPAERKGAYRFLESPKVRWEPLAEAVHVATARRCSRHALVIGIVDGSSIAHTDRRGDDGVGSVGSRRMGGRGIKSMILLAASFDGVPLGVGAHVLWSRPDTPGTSDALRPLAEKESRHWTGLQEEFESVLRAEGADTRVWYQIDREGDASHVLLRGVEPGQMVTVRSNKDRLVNARTLRRGHLKLREAIASAPDLAAIYIEVPRGPKRTPRIARLELRTVGVGFELRALWSKKRLGEVHVTAVQAREAGTCPDGEEPLDWLLLTTFPVHTLDDAIRVVRAYTQRWLIERLHYTWKTGTCGVESSQLESFDALCKWATLHLSVAAHRQHILHLSRTQPELPADEIFARDEIDAALLLFKKHRKDAPALGSTPLLGTMVDIIARLGGYIGKSSGGPPGIKTFGRGMDRVADAAEVVAMLRANGHMPTSNDGFG